MGAQHAQSSHERGSHAFQNNVARKAERRAKAEREDDRSIWFGLGMFGLVGWTVAVPTLVGTGIGLWIDSKWPSRYSWTLTGLFLGVVIGCWGAWRWAQKESGHE